jgi:hypothetical protein
MVNENIFLAGLLLVVTLQISLKVRSTSWKSR